jgi:hypothetical protein
VHLLSDDRRIDKDPRADDAAHHDHRGVEKTQTAREL